MNKLNSIDDMVNKPVTTFTWSIVLPVLVIPLSIALLYVLGRGWDMGYLAEFGVQDDLVYGGIDRTLFFGIFSVTAIVKICLTVCGFSSGLMILIISADIIKDKIIIKNILKKLKMYAKKPSSVKDQAANVINNLVLAILYGFSIIFSCLLLFIVMQLSHDAGKQIAISMKKNFYKSFIAWHNHQRIDDKFFQKLIPVEHHDWPVEVGYVVASNSSYTAFFTENGTKTYPSNSIRFEQIDRG